MSQGSGNLGAAAALVAGAALALGTGIVAAARRDRALHTDGYSRRAELVMTGGAGYGVPLLDDAGTHDVRVRFSQGGSLPGMARDVVGAALYVPGAAADGGVAQLLLASSTGNPREGLRLRLVRPGERAPLSSLLSYETSHGPLHLGLLPGADDSWELVVAPRGAGWDSIGVLRLVEPCGDPGRTDPTRRLPAGLAMPLWQQALRAPAYFASRRLGHR